MAEQAEKQYRVRAADGLTVTDEKGREHHLARGSRVPRSAFRHITWLVEQGLVEAVEDAARGEADAPPRAAPPPPPAADEPEGD